jgi:hypothetical protein
VTFEEALLGWHDFYVAAAGAAAALLGLLFVGVSINLGALKTAERIDLRERASQAFTNLTFVLVLSLSVLIPQEDPQSLAIACTILVAIGIARIASRLRTIRRTWNQTSPGILAIRRLAWTAFAIVFLADSAWNLWSTGSSGAMYDLIAVTFLLLLGAADVSWDLLVRVSNEEAGPESTSAVAEAADSG